MLRAPLPRQVPDGEVEHFQGGLLVGELVAVAGDSRSRALVSSMRFVSVDHPTNLGRNTQGSGELQPSAPATASRSPGTGPAPAAAKASSAAARRPDAAVLTGAGPAPAAPGTCGRHPQRGADQVHQHSSTTAWGQTAPVAPGRPASPSQHTRHTSATPRPLSSENGGHLQNLAAPLLGPVPRPRPLGAVAVIPITR